MRVGDILRRIYHGVVPLALRQTLRLSRFSPSRRARARLWQRTGGRTAAGPFAGFRLAGDTPDDCYGPVLLGSYECDVHPWLERELARGWTVAVNIGSNTGYYSTGLAMRLPGAAVHAFEMDDALRAETAAAAARNGVGDRVLAHGAASPEALAALPIAAALVVTDCEGAERELMDPARVSWLSRSAMLVELHDFNVPGTTEALLQRFATTHDAEVVRQSPRDPRIWAARAGITPADAALLADERRPVGDAHVNGRWMLLTPRADRGQAR